MCNLGGVYCDRLLLGVDLLRGVNFTVRRNALEQILLMSEKAVPLHPS